MILDDFIRILIGYEQIAVLDFEVEPDIHHPDEQVFVATAALDKEDLYRCPICGQICGKYDSSGFVKRWRSLDLGKNKFFIECVYPRLICPEHGVKKCRIPWAFPDSDYTRAFEMRVAYAAAKSPTNFVAREYRVKWHTVGNCVKRVQQFFESLTEEQCAGIEYVVADGARWITRQVEAFCPNAVRCIDPFHVVGWAAETLDTVRKRLTDDTKKNVLRS